MAPKSQWESQSENKATQLFWQNVQICRPVKMINDERLFLFYKIHVNHCWGITGKQNQLNVDHWYVVKGLQLIVVLKICLPETCKQVVDLVFSKTVTSSIKPKLLRNCFQTTTIPLECPESRTIERDCSVEICRADKDQKLPTQAQGCNCCKM